MTPLEINFKIARIKYPVLIKDIIKDDFEYYCSTCFAESFNWAESITVAWQLFEELDSIITKDRYNGAYSKGKWLCTYETLFPEEVLIHGPQADDGTAMAFWNNPHWVVAADTAPLAICLAWLKWKEEK